MENTEVSAGCLAAAHNQEKDQHMTPVKQYIMMFTLLLEFHRLKQMRSDILIFHQIFHVWKADFVAYGHSQPVLPQFPVLMLR